MKKFLPLLLLPLLAACHKDQAPTNQDTAPKAEFTFKRMTVNDMLKNMPVKTEGVSEQKGVKHRRYSINGLPTENTIEIVGNMDEDLESIDGTCMEADAKGKKTGWPQGGICEKVFRQLATNSLKDADKITAYMLKHSGLQPLSDRGGYTAVQSGYYVLEVSSLGKFHLRRLR